MSRLDYYYKWDRYLRGEGDGQPSELLRWTGPFSGLEKGGVGVGQSDAITVSLIKLRRRAELTVVILK